jgi:Fic family protein
MKMPGTPPKAEDLYEDLDPDKVSLLFSQPNFYVKGDYIHWDKLRHLTPPEGMTLNEWWLAIKWRRRSQATAIPLAGINGKAFQYLVPTQFMELLHKIDLGAGGTIEIPEPIINPDTKERYYVHSLMEESITSSKLEGAATTRRVAKDMIRRNRKPRDKSERMILNNYLTMKRIGELKKEDLSKELVVEIYNLITKDTLSAPDAVNRFRKDEEKIIVGDDYGSVFHKPPPADQLEERMAAMCEFANCKTPKAFIHPVIRSIILHFWLAYDHPFVDGNGRTARALFYWSMLRHGYWLFEYISISNIIHKVPARYGRSFLYTETDDNDLTYFIDFNLKVIHKAVQELHHYIERKTHELRVIERDLRGIELFNHRQRDLISHAIRHPGYRYTIESHQTSHNVTHRTARLDLLDLKDRGLMSAEKIGRRWYFTPVPDMAEKMADLTR